MPKHNPVPAEVFKRESINNKTILLTFLLKYRYLIRATAILNFLRVNFQASF